MCHKEEEIGWGGPTELEDGVLIEAPKHNFKKQTFKFRSL
jgi:hypothetical protein